MKVSEFIDYLKGLDNSKDIWIAYDGGFGYVISPDCVEVYDENNVHLGKPCDCKIGDYVFDIS